MSYPTITYGHAPYITDCENKTSWTEWGAPTLGGTSLTVLYGDYLQIEGTPAGAGDEATYFGYAIPAAQQINTSTYPYFLVRYKTSAASDGCGARVRVGFTVGEQWLLGETVPQFSSTWKVVSGTLTPAKTLNRLDFWADDYPDAVAAGTFQVYYDFVLFCQDIFTFPKCNVALYLPNPRIADIPIPGREGQILQNLGSEKARVHLWEEMTQETTGWGTPKGQRFYQIAHEMGSDLWQWLTLSSHNCAFKVCLESAPQIDFVEGKLTFDLWFKEYKLADAAVMESYSERFGHV